MHKTQRKKTLLDIQEKKNSSQKISMLTAYDAPWARLIDTAGIDLILVGDSLGMVVLGRDNTTSVTMDEMLLHCKSVSSVVKQAIIVGDMPFGSYNTSFEEAIKNANLLVKVGGVDCIKIEGGGKNIDTAREIVSAGIPVVGHIGLTPQTATSLGGFKVQGRNADQARELLSQARALEKAGCFALVIEAVPSEVATLISDAISIPTIGIGAGSGCSGQVLVTHDLVGFYDGHSPKFVKEYASVRDVIFNAISSFKDDVENLNFPEKSHTFKIDNDELEKIY